MTDKKISAAPSTQAQLDARLDAADKLADETKGSTQVQVILRLSSPAENDLVAQFGARLDEFLRGLNGRVQNFPLVLTKQEVADRLQVSVRTIDTLIAEGEIAATKVRGQVRISSDALESYFRKSTRRGGVR